MKRYSAMTTMLRLLGCTLLLASAARAAGPEYIRISDSRKTVDRRTSGAQEVPRGTTSLTEKQVVLTFKLQRMSPQVPEQVNVEWVVMKEGMDGRLAEADRGSAVAMLPLGRPEEVETAPIALDERSWSVGGGRHHRSGNAEDDVAGYGLRIKGADGKVLAERYEPDSFRTRIDWEAAPRLPAGARIRGLDGKKAERLQAPARAP